jgi:hypothetical protein
LFRARIVSTLRSNGVGSPPLVASPGPGRVSSSKLRYVVRASNQVSLLACHSEFPRTPWICDALAAMSPTTFPQGSLRRGNSFKKSSSLRDTSSGFSAWIRCVLARSPTIGVRSDPRVFPGR